MTKILLLFRELAFHLCRFYVLTSCYLITKVGHYDTFAMPAFFKKASSQESKSQNRMHRHRPPCFNMYSTIYSIHSIYCIYNMYNV